jgi:NAD(P)-dependent dehydrogenase (short-subunit alcohol dehydrogenase family)
MAGRVVIVTGGGGGIGRAVAAGLAAEGATVVVADLGCDPDGRGRDAAFAETIAREINRRGGHAVAVCADVSRPDECRDLVSHTVRAFGRVDALCHAAGVVRQALVQEATDEDWDAVLGVHAAGARHLAEACIVPMRERGHGRVVLFSSRSVTGSPGLSTYSTAKGAVLAYGRALADELAGSGVHVNVVLPSGRTRASAPRAPSARRRRIELMRARHHGIADPVAYRNAPEQDPENNVAAIIWLCGPGAGNGLLVGTGGRRVELYRPGAVEWSLPLSEMLTPEDITP